MKFFGERKRLKEMAEREAAGETLFTDKFEEAVRYKISYAFADVCGRVVHSAAAYSQALYRRAFGVPFLTGANTDESEDFMRFLMRCPDDVMPTLIEIMDRSTFMSYDYFAADTDAFRQRVNEIFDDHRITYDLIDGHMVPFESREMHQEIVAPTLQLLAGRPDLESVEQAYQDAVREIAKNPGDAITDAGRTLQELLMLLGAKGNQLGDLAGSARQQGLLAPHDPTLAAGIEKIITWVAADRSQKGDTHTNANPTPDDAWLAVHVVGALILRLAGGPRSA